MPYNDGGMVLPTAFIAVKFPHDPIYVNMVFRFINYDILRYVFLGITAPLMKVPCLPFVVLCHRWQNIDDQVVLGSYNDFKIHQSACIPWFVLLCSIHYVDVLMSTISSQINSLTTVYSTVYSDADQRKHQSSASLAFVHQWAVTRKMFPFHDVIMLWK